MTLTEKAIRDYCGHRADWWPSASQVQAMLALAQDQFKPDYNTKAVLVEEMQRMAKRINDAVLAEREACAKEAENTFYSVQAAENIRARGQA